MKTNNSKTPPRGVILFFAWSCLAFTALCLGRVVLDARLAACGVIADGVVTKLETNTTYGGGSSSRRSTSRRSSDASTSHYGTVRFAPAGGEARDFKTVSTFGHELKAGDAVKVIHLPWNPGAAEIYSAKQVWLPLGAGITVTLITGGLGWFLLRLARRKKTSAGPGSRPDVRKPADFPTSPSQPVHPLDPAANPAAPPLPGLRSLYFLDRPLRRALTACGFGFLFCLGIRWVTAPQPNAVVKVENSPIEIWVMQWGSVIGLVVAALALFVVLRRYLWIKRVLGYGTTIKGTVEDVDIFSREADFSSTTPAFRRPKAYTYYAVIRYSWRGVDRKVRLNLPHPPSTHQLFKGRDTELMVLDSSPGRPLIRSVYVEPIGIRRR